MNVTLREEEVEESMSAELEKKGIKGKAKGKAS